MSWQLDGTTLCTDARAHVVCAFLHTLEINGKAVNVALVCLIAT